MESHHSRRAFLQSAGCGFGYLAFAGMTTAAADKSLNPLEPKRPHFEPKAKRVVFLCMDGGPSHVDTFDYKPKLQQDDGKSFGKGRFPFSKLLASPWKFRRRGTSGLWISDLFPEVAKHADELCILNGMATDVPAHPQAFLSMHTGMFQFKRPSMGSWVLYGLGTENANLPGFVTISPPANNGGPSNYASAFLPAVYQGTPIGNAGRPIAQAAVKNIANPRLAKAAQRTQLDYLQELNRGFVERESSHPGVEGLIESYELAFRMQAAVPDVMDVAKESKATLDRYGIDGGVTDDFGRQCLLARRFAEAGVRYIEVCHPGWDQHRNLKADHERRCQATDKPIAGLLADLKSRGMLKDTLVIWGGEFGRTPYAQGADGRDHNNKGYSMWMAGGGVKGGFVHGKTDDYGYEAVADRVHTHDWHATVLHLLGLDHTRLTYRYAGRDMRLTDIKGEVVHPIIA